MRKYLYLFCLPISIFANPSGSQVISGNVSIHEEGNHLFITAGDRTIIEWQKFSIGEKEMAQFIQPGSTAAVLNKVVGDMPSSIMGKMIANGHVLLINPHGILMGQNSTIDTGALTLSTLPLIDDQSFLKNESLHFCQNGQSYLHSQGTIVAQTGDVVLIGPSITLEGNATAPLGTVRIGAGCDIVLNPEGEERIFIQPSKFSSLYGMDIRGQITALNAELKADGNAYALAICVGDMRNSSKIVSKGGRVLLVAEGGDVWFKGEIAAPGGEVQILGKNITLGDTASIDASSHENGGSIYIGGGYQGNDPLLYPSQRTVVSKGATLTSKSLEKGDGGRIILWSEGLTSFLGKIDAEGGKLGGNGGFIEVSGLETLDYRGTVSTLAPLGKTGTLLLDPFLDITIVAGAMGGSVLVTAVTPFTPLVGGACAPGPGNSTLTDGDLNAALGVSSVVIETTSTSAPGNPCPGDIIFDPSAVVTWATANILTLDAARDINVNSSVTCTSTGPIIATAARNINIGTPAGTIATGLTTMGSVSATATTGSITVQGGTGAGTSSATVVGATAVIASAPAGNISVLGGAGTGTSDASINTLAFLNVSAGGSLTVMGGTSTMSSQASIITASIGVDTISAGGNITLQGGSGTGTDHASIIKISSSTMNLTAGGTLTMQGGTINGEARIFGGVAGGAIFVTAGAIQMRGGNTPGNTQAHFFMVNAYLNINCLGDMIMFSNPTSQAAISSLTQIDIVVAGNFDQHGFGGAGQDASIDNFMTPSIPININVGGNYTLTTGTIATAGGDLTIVTGGNFTQQQDPSATVSTSIFTAIGPGGSISITAGNNIAVSGLMTGVTSGIVTADADILMIAGNDFTIGDFVGIGSGLGADVTLVCDNDFPTPPGIGTGRFTLAATSFVGSPFDQVRIFTARRGFNSVLGTINGATFVPGPLLVDSNNERWFVYYPNSFFSPPFVFFYKAGDLPTALVTTDFPDFMEMFRDLHPFSEYIDLAIEYSITEFSTPRYYYLHRRTYENINVLNQINGERHAELRSENAELNSSQSDI